MQQLEKALLSQVRDTVVKWKKEAYPKFLGRYKAVRKAENEFDKARKYVHPMKLCSFRNDAAWI